MSRIGNRELDRYLAVLVGAGLLFGLLGWLAPGVPAPLKGLCEITGLGLIGGLAYWMGWTSQRMATPVQPWETDHTRPAPRWLSWLCARPGRPLLPNMVVLQLGAMGAVIGDVASVLLHGPQSGGPLMAVTGGALPVLALLLWGVFGLTRRTREYQASPAEGDPPVSKKVKAVLKTAAGLPADVWIPPGIRTLLPPRVTRCFPRGCRP